MSAARWPIKASHRGSYNIRLRGHRVSFLPPPGPVESLYMLFFFSSMIDHHLCGRSRSLPFSLIKKLPSLCSRSCAGEPPLFCFPDNPPGPRRAFAAGALAHQDAGRPEQKEMRQKAQSSPVPRFAITHFFYMICSNYNIPGPECNNFIMFFPCQKHVR